MKQEILKNNFEIIRCNKCSVSDWEKINNKLKCSNCNHLYSFNENNQLISVEDYIVDKNWEDVTTSFDLFKDNPKPYSSNFAPYCFISDQIPLLRMMLLVLASRNLGPCSLVLGPLGPLSSLSLVLGS